ncbi:MAG TPA: hypothetical protein VJ892_03190 [Candidatus Absconditabacterales bacterium]|nr:hypothetical protein [Candidatus Absconditabacterales bacterium]
MITKGGTFVEGIFSTTSFLPYLNNDWQSKFYQGFLFDSCLDLEIDKNGKPEYKDSLCHITTRDYKTYYANVESGHIRSDGVPFTIDDVFFTYNEIIKSNKLGIPYLDFYKDIEVELEGNKIKIVFKNSSEDNTLFFTNYILPKHALIEPNLDMYQQSFAIEPVYNNCAKIKSQSTDQYSLIFDLSNCEDTNLGFYQIKNTTSFDNFKKGIQEGNGSIVDAYEGNENLKGYEEINLESNKLITVFFNTKDSKMKVRLRRALGGLIMHNFFDGEENEYMKKYDRDIFNYYLSTGDNIKDFINRIDTKDGLSKEDLIDSGVGELTGKINFTTKHKTFAFYTEDSKQKFLLRLNFDEEYDKIAIQHNSGDLYYPSSYNSKKKYTDYGVSPQYKNLNEGLNKYIIYSIDGDDKEQIGTLNIYNLYKKINNDEAVKEQVKILYFDNNLSNYVIGKLKQIFKQYNISDSFVYEKVSDANELEGKLTAGEYDILINTINMGLSTDISKLFSTEMANINPSQYTNARLLSLLKQYNESKNKSNIISEINKIYANDMPMVVLGREFVKLNIKEQTIKKLDMDEINLYEYNWRKEIYKNLSLTENVYIDKDKAKDLGNFWRYIKNPNNY